MPHEYSITEIKGHLAEAVRAAEQGEPVTITRRGRPVAVLLSIARYEALRAAHPGFREVAWDIRVSSAREGVEFTDADFAGLRDVTPGRDVDL